MKYCPLCDRRYGDEVAQCEVDGASLRLLGVKRDPYSGKLLKGRYSVQSKIGEGGMGSVYLAEQVSIGRKVALKVLQGNYASDDEFIGRFRREARLAASLNHRNIVTVYDFDQSDDGSLFIAMEYLQGEKLSEVIRKEGPLDISRAVRLGLQIADGLAAAHRAGVIHRDIKPDNVMVVGAPGNEDIKLMDFGIARMMDTGTVGNLTRPGMIMGTPAYMAPEQAEGSEISEQTDLYALGIVLYEMLSGTVPFKAPTPSAVLIKQLQEAPAPLRKLRREVPAALERIVMRALEKKPQKRPRDMNEILQELQKVDAALVVQDSPKTMMQTMVFKSGARERIKLPKAPGFLIGASSLVAVLILGIIVYWTVGTPNQTDDSKKLASLSIQGAKRELRVGEKTLLRAAGKFSDGSAAASARSLKWQSSNETVVTISPKGEAEGRKAGFADVTVSSQGIISAPVTLIVRAAALPPAEQKPSLSEKIDDQIKHAGSLLDQGDYSGALKVLHGAKALDPKNKNLHAEIDRARKACLAEQRIGLTKSSCD